MKKTRHRLEDKMVKLQEEIKLLKYTMEGYSKKTKRKRRLTRTQSAPL